LKLLFPDIGDDVVLIAYLTPVDLFNSPIVISLHAISTSYLDVGLPNLDISYGFFYPPSALP
jgi:hypothetical protein